MKQNMFFSTLSLCAQCRAPLLRIQKRKGYFSNVVDPDRYQYRSGGFYDDQNMKQLTLLKDTDLFKTLNTVHHCSGSVTFGYGSGSVSLE
jgi:hypothetical protein